MGYMWKHIGIREEEYYTVYENETFYSIPIELFIRIGERKYNTEFPITEWYNNLSKEDKRTIKLEATSYN